MSRATRVLIFTGEGKGKTTAALGMAMRAAGHDMPVAVVQFIKHDATVGEVKALANFPKIRLAQTGLGFVPTVSSPEYAKHKEAAREGLRKAEELIVSGEYGLVVLDEVCVAIAKGLLEEERVIEVVGKASDEACVVMTGRGASETLMAVADTVTEMRCVKHGARAGRRRRRGWSCDKSVSEAGDCGDGQRRGQDVAGAGDRGGADAAGAARADVQGRAGFSGPVVSDDGFGPAVL